MARYTVGELIDELEMMDEDAKIYIAVYQRYTPPEDYVKDLAQVEVDGEQRVYLECDQTGEYIPGVVRDEFGW